MLCVVCCVLRVACCVYDTPQGGKLRYRHPRAGKRTANYELQTMNYFLFWVAMLPQMRRLICNSKCKIHNHWCPVKIILIDEKTIVARVSWFCKSRRLASAQPDNSTLGDASFAVSFVLKLNNGIAEIPTAAQLKGERQMQHRKAYERLAGLRPSW